MINLRSNLERRFRIGRPECLAGDGGGGTPPELCSVVAGGWRLAGAGRKWPSGLVLGCRLVQKDELGTCSPLGLTAGLDGGSGGVRDGAGGGPRRSAVP